jgi:DNA-binding transcriptional MerR regulator
MISITPAYNLKAVLKETGLKADVLRAWERRYELPTPQRTPGGHRLYSEYDIETIKWLRARQAEGLAISRAVELWKETIEAGLDPLVQHPATTNATTTAQRMPATETRIEILRQNWLAANFAFDSISADEILNQAIAIYPVETVCTHILQQGVSEIGEYWYSNKASVQQEHFATAQARRRLETLISATPPPTRQQTILIGCPPGEQHTLSLMLLNLFLRRRGIQVIYLGADIPTLLLAETAGTIKPDLIVLSAQQLSTAASLRSTLLALQGTGIPLAYGGLIFNRLPSLRQRMPAFFLGETLEAAVQMIESLVINPDALPQPTTMAATGQALSKIFNEKRLRVEATVFESLSKAALQPEFIDVANSFFGNALSAALEFGDPSFLDADLDWLKRLLTSRHMSAELLIPYLTAYQNAFQKELGAAGMPVIEWIEHYLAQNRATKDE